MNPTHPDILVNRLELSVDPSGFILLLLQSVATKIVR